MYHHAQLIFEFLVETGFHYVGQAGLESLTSGDLPALKSQNAGIIGVSHCARPFILCPQLNVPMAEPMSVTSTGLWGVEEQVPIKPLTAHK
ncbi:hypothetical protein AAY473_008462 [Plecturocebus cupreus]